MSLKALTKNQKGFTIIEVMIVLAIAGLIILVVFLAVPALQRNSRNTQRKNDIQSILGGIQEWINNNNGRAPEEKSGEASEIYEAITNAQLGYYDASIDAVTDTSEIYINSKKIDLQADAESAPALTVLPTGAGSPDASSRDYIYILSGADCEDIKPDLNGPARSLALWYAIEAGSGNTTDCVSF